MKSSSAVVYLCVFGFVIAAGCNPSSGGGATGVKKAIIQNKGSDTMVEAAQAWAEEYHDADVEVSGGGSGTGIAALIDGKVDIANSSRALKPEEIEDAKKKTGKDPLEFIVGYDALAIYVHKDTPLAEISVEQLAQIYGDGGSISNWSDLNVKIQGCPTDGIVRASRQNNSGTYEYFREAVLGAKGKYKLGSVDLSGSRDLVKTVGTTPCAIGYSGMSYKTDEVKFVNVRKGDGKAVGPSIPATHDGSYPISRPLFMYTLGRPTGAAKDYLDWVRSEPGQKVLERMGYVPLKKEQMVPAPMKAAAR
jgi:phosphate transport system substrate-binding protein